MWGDMGYLVCQIAPLQSQVGADVLVDGPGKLVVELPGDEAKSQGCDGHEHRDGDEHGLDGEPEVGGDEVLVVEDLCGVSDLVVLDGGVDHDADVVDDEADDLDGVLQAQGVPDEEQLVQVGEHEDGEVGGDGAGIAVDVGCFKVQRGLEEAKDITGGARLAQRDRRDETMR